MSELKISPASDNMAADEKMFVRPIDLNITFAQYFRLKFEAVNRGMLMSAYIREMLQNEENVLDMDPETLSLMRKLSSFVDDLDYYIVWGGDGFWRIRKSGKHSQK